MVRDHPASREKAEFRKEFGIFIFIKLDVVSMVKSTPTSRRGRWFFRRNSYGGDHPASQ